MKLIKVQADRTVIQTWLIVPCFLVGDQKLASCFLDFLCEFNLISHENSGSLLINEFVR